uniref:Uncharacterized protein n=2 Tax=Meloidogyne TaxID=189290 RepID=A0A6V7VI62_MELEN|nr:unnamed protein product [Meloidogyne enterolobii]
MSKNLFNSILLISIFPILLNLFNEANCSSSSSDKNVLVIPPLYTPEQTGLNYDKAIGVIDKFLNIRYFGNFSFHPFAPDASNSGGECGLGTLYKYHAGFSSELIIPDPLGKNWVPAKFNPKQYIRNDKVCIGICAKIEANGKTLILPLMDETSWLAHNQLDLSEAAFKYLESNPNAGWVPAYITYQKC